MDIIFLDTSIFERGNFLQGNEIKQLMGLSESEHLKIIMPKITYKEIIGRVEKNIKDSISKFTSFQSSGKVLKNFSEFEQVFRKVDEHELLRKFVKLLDHQLKKSNVVILDYPKIDIGEIFDKYFNKEHPFSERKKEEFPDAFTLYTLELWCKDEDKRCIVFSADNDMLNYKSDVLIINKDLKGYISNTLTDIERKKKRNSRLDNLNLLYSSERERLKKEIVELALEEININPNKFIKSEHFIEKVTLKDRYISLGNYQILSVTDSNITIELKALLHFTVICDIEDIDNNFYNNLDGDWSYKTIQEEAEIETVLLSQFIAHIPIHGQLMDAKISLHKILFDAGPNSYFY